MRESVASVKRLSGRKMKNLVAQLVANRTPGRFEQAIGKPHVSCENIREVVEKTYSWISDQHLRFRYVTLFEETGREEL